QNLHVIGKKRGIGYGQISSISVDVINEDYSLIDSEGYPSRVIPLSEAEGLNVPDNKRNIMLHSYKPTYYNPKNRVVCLTPRLNIPKLVVDSVDDEDEFDEEINYGQLICCLSSITNYMVLKLRYCYSRLLMCVISITNYMVLTQSA